jgi:transketolase
MLSPKVNNQALTSAQKNQTGVFLSLKTSRIIHISELKEKAKQMRRDIVNMITTAGSGHPGGSLSSVEILTSLYFEILNHNPADPHWAERDRFILSKGHAAPVLYAALAASGYLSQEELCTLRKLDSRLQGHPECEKTPGVEMSAGALGQGLSFGVGVTLAGRLNSQKYRTYVLLGDGECDEGQVWEAAMAAAHFKLDNLVAIVDNNGIQLDGFTRDIMSIEPLNKKWLSFGWKVIEVDGHDIAKLIAAFKRARKTIGQPTVIIAHTVKGKGVSFMENNPAFHGKAPNSDEFKIAMKELE